MKTKLESNILSETNVAPLEIDGWKMLDYDPFPLGMLLFQGAYVSFREGNGVRVSASSCVENSEVSVILVQHVLVQRALYAEN